MRALGVDSSLMSDEWPEAHEEWQHFICKDRLKEPVVRKTMFQTTSAPLVYAYRWRVSVDIKTISVQAVDGEGG